MTNSEQSLNQCCKHLEIKWFEFPQPFNGKTGNWQCRNCGVIFQIAPNDFSSEISVLDEDFKKHASQKALDIIESFYNILKARDAEITRLREPVLVSLDKCTKQVEKWFITYRNRLHPYDARYIAKAVLDSAGVDYDND